MGIVVRQSILNTAISYLGVLLGAINLVWLFPMMLGETQFGLTRLLLSASLIASQIAQLGMGNVTYRFFPLFRNPDKDHHGFLRILHAIPFVGFLMIVAIFFLFRGSLSAFFNEKAPLFIQYELYLIPLSFFILYFNVIEAWLVSVYRTIASSFIRELVLRAFQLASVYAYHLEWVDFYVFILLFIGSQALSTIILYGWAMLSNEFAWKTPYAEPRPGIQRDMRDYAFYAILGGISAIAVTNLDILMVGGFLGEASAGFYAIAFFIGSIITIPERSISKISYPIIAEAFKHEDKEKIEVLYRKTALNQLIIGSLIFIGIWSNTHNMIQILPDGFEQARYVVILIGAAKLMDMSTGANGIILLNSPWYRYDLMTNVALVVLTIITNSLLIPAYGLTGAAMATLITIAVYNTTKFSIIWWKMRLQPFQKSTLIVLFISLLTLVIGHYIPKIDSLWIDILIRSLLISLMYSIFILMFRVSEDIESIRFKLLSRVKEMLTFNAK